jgi:hypothetical protein
MKKTQTAAPIQMPTIKSYGDYSGSGNYGAHCLRVDVGPLRVWFSYETPVAFHKDGGEKVVRRNDWSTTTGKHLNLIDGGGKAQKSRVTGVEFERLYAEAMGK